MTLTQLQHLLLDLFSTEREVSAAAVQALADDDWERLMTMVREHRLGPMLHWRLERERRDLAVPETIRTRLGNTFKQAALRSLVWQRELLLSHRILEQAGIPHVALKGAYLALHAYPHPALRPMRDLDILVPQDRALAAFDALIAAGLERPQRYQGDPESFASVCQHLPPLRSPSGQVSVEIHTRLTHPDPSGAGPLDLAEDPDYWRRCITRPAGAETLLYTAPTDLLLHLIVHAAYDHGFSNGPLVFSDLAYLLASHDIDWPLFWRLADEHGFDRGCVLTLKMTERYFGNLDIVWPEGANTEPAVLEDACLLSLRSFEDSLYVDLAATADANGSLSDKARFIIGKLFPPKQQIAKLYPVSAQSPKVYLWYLVKWWHLAAVMLPRHLRSARSGHTAHETGRLARLNRWLGDGATG